MNNRFKNYINNLALNIKIQEFDNHTRTSQDAANILNCNIGQIAKSIVLIDRQTDSLVIVITSGANRVDLDKVSRILKTTIEKASSKEVKTKSGYEPGGVAPIGFKEHAVILMDQDLLSFDKIWPSAGTLNSLFQIKPSELLKISNAQIVDIALEK